MIVTIDGPAASGKSTVSRELARRWKCDWVSTGAFYRGLAFVALQMHVDLDDVPGLTALSKSPVWAVQMTPEKTLVYLQSQDVTDLIAHEDVGSFASRISHYPEVRASLLDHQRQCARGRKLLIAEGRDCGTVVFPQAEVKIYLTADSRNRAARRAAEQGASADQIQEAQKQRDHQDSSRKTAPLQIPENAHVIDTSEMTLPEVIDHIDKIVKSIK